MKKTLYLSLTFIFGISFLFTSCLNNDDDNKIDEEWRTFQNSVFLDVTKTAGYDTLYSQTGNGFIMWQPSSVITDTDSKSTRISDQGYPEFTDTVVVRYEGWYLDLNKKKIIFDSTESPSLSNSSNPNQVPREFPINGIIEGWSTALQRMKIGDEKLIVVPQQLGYGSSIQYNSSNVETIPAYTTLWFRIKLLGIKSMKPIN